MKRELSYDSCMARRRFREFEPGQNLLIGPDLNEWLPKRHLARFVAEVVETLDVSAVERWYERGGIGGRPPYDPRMMLRLMIMGYCGGIFSSRAIERATYEMVPMRWLAADQHPDHDTIAAFRQRHLKELADLFKQVFTLCRQAGLVELGTVALDGSKIRANASKHKAMSYGRMQEKEIDYEKQIKKLLATARDIDEDEDARLGRKGAFNDLPDELEFAENRLKRIREAKAALEAEAKEAAKRKREEKGEDEDPPAQGGAKPEDAKKDLPDAKAQRNFTDPDSRIMIAGATKSFEQCYNAEVVVDGTAQVIVACDVTQSAADSRQLQPMWDTLMRSTGNRKPKRFLADAGFASKENLEFLAGKSVDTYIALGKMKHADQQPATPRGRIPKDLGILDRMRRKLRTKAGKAIYAARKAIVEPVFGQIKAAQGFRQFLLRGFEKVRAEFQWVCTTHNLLKLFRATRTSDPSTEKWSRTKVRLVESIV